MASHDARRPEALPRVSREQQKVLELPVLGIAAVNCSAGRVRNNGA
jgi:hypothetical protein